MAGWPSNVGNLAGRIAAAAGDATALLALAVELAQENARLEAEVFTVKKAEADRKEKQAERTREHRKNRRAIDTPEAEESASEVSRSVTVSNVASRDVTLPAVTERYAGNGSPSSSLPSPSLSSPTPLINPSSPHSPPPPPAIAGNGAGEGRLVLDAASAPGELGGRLDILANAPPENLAVDLDTPPVGPLGKRAQRAEDTRRAREARAADVEAVVEHYKARHPLRRPGEKERNLIARHLGTYTVAELRDAIDGNADSEWEQRVGKHELTYILRDNSMIDNYRAKAQATPQGVTLDGQGWFAQ